MQDPRGEYERRRDRHLAEAAARAAEATRWSNGRLLVFVGFIGMLVAVGNDILSPLWLLAFVPVFGWFVTRHARAEHGRLRAEQSADLYKRGLRRLDGEWMQEGDEGRDLCPEHHVYAEDLDLFGPGSLFQLVSEARTPPGRRCLADWWLEPADRETILRRQAAVQELRGQLDLREELQTVGQEVSSALGRATALAWAQTPRRIAPSLLPTVLAFTGPINFLLVFGWLLFDLPLWLPSAGLLIQGLFCLRGRQQVGEVLEAAEEPVTELGLIARMLERLEEARFEAADLVAIQQSLTAGGERPSRLLASFLRMGSFIEARDNHLYHPVSWVLGISTRIAHGIEAWRERYGEQLEVWMRSLGRYEAHASIATYAYEQEGVTWPELLEDGVRYDVEGVGHPLLPVDACVLNDLALTRPAQGDVSQVLVVSGSNMSGKSTLLRSVGLSIVMGNAGGPVRAKALRYSPVALAASIRVLDSLQEGASRFYAEIERLKQVVERARGDIPCLFLLDEILHGTNSKDRRIGATAVLDTLLDLGSIGLVTTHDLALTQVADERRAVGNVHFQDELIDGRMVFDYQMKPGVVTRSNALALMRSVGLAVEEPLAPPAEVPAPKSES